MTLRTMPQLPRITNRSDIGFETLPKVLQRWDEDIRAAAEDDEATISILEPIGANLFGEGVTAKRVAGALRAIGNQDVVINMNSPGGNYFEGVAIYNLLRQHPKKITVRILGLAASAASFVAMAGDRIEIAKTGQIFIHNAQGVVQGDRNDMRDIADALESFDKVIAEVYAARSGLADKTVARMMDKETFFTGQKAIDSGLADEFLSSDSIGKRVRNEADTSFIAALRRLDVIMAQAGVSRSERRGLMNEIKSGMPRAAEDITPSADVDPDLLARLSQIDIPLSNQG